jgi:hypothetical protein
VAELGRPISERLQAFARNGRFKGSPYTPLKAARGGHAAHHARPADASGPQLRYSFLLSLSSIFLFFLLCFGFAFSKFEKIEIRKKSKLK